MESVTRVTTAASGTRTRPSLVSHRFSTVNAADRVLVLADQQIAEYGTHDELVAAGHLYAELYDLQARSYRA